MIVLITGASHTGKTALAQNLLERYGYPYLSIDHLKMGLIRSGYTSLTPESDDEGLTEYLWPVVREMIKTAVENRQNLIVEGCYIPFDWEKDFVMSEKYIRSHFDDIKAYASVIEERMDDGYCTMESVLADNRKILNKCRSFHTNFILIDEEYKIDIKL